MRQKVRHTRPAERIRPEHKQAAKTEIVGFLDRIDKAGLGGWAADFANPAASIKLRVLIDGRIADVISCDLRRDDAALLKLPINRIGFYYNIPPRYHDGTRHVLKFAALDGEAIVMSSRNGSVGEFHFCLSQPVRFEGVLDGVVDGVLQGWVIHVDDHAGTKAGGVRVLVTSGMQPVAELRADEMRADVAKAVGCDPNCGFSFSPPAELYADRHVEFRFFAMPGHHELTGSPVEVNFPGQDERDRLNGLIKRADELFAFAYHLRRQLNAALPGERYLLRDYARWARKSMPLALARAKARYGALPPTGPLVSIVCPVFRPPIADFLAAVDSVRCQTYQNWELLLIDDGSKDTVLTGVLQDLGARETRIKVQSARDNSGISAATNRGIAAAKGKFLVFFDHDDLLEPAALEIMLRAQHATRAKFLYSDEDKVSGNGILSEPHFKPDFNHRFLLEVNYICHLVMVETALLRKVGPLDKRFDGAQDHDLLLRIAEILPPGQIHHVPEILYHWRKSSGSTAAAGSAAKPKAAAAGAAAVKAHLKRQGRAAEVTTRLDTTCYRVDWKVPAAATRQAKVSIIIPYRDHIDMTAECVAAVRRYVKDIPYEIILLDNWSTVDEAENFAAGQANMAHTKIMRILEPFNYSRINNMAARAADGEFLLFMNNDVIVHDRHWLPALLNECLSDEKIGAVGGKLLYPNGTVQHAGVVLGVGGVADHAFRGIPADAPGYVMRAAAAQRISAVTAACMLVRKSAFEAVGGFDEDELTVAFNDVDLCIKLSLAGWGIIFTPDSVAEHRESISRGDDLDESKIARFMLENEVMKRRYAALLPQDPFYNVHFSRESGLYKELRILSPAEDDANCAPDAAR